ncbi:MAG: polyprenyl synthetase family protein [Phycisphaerae bacterium]|nr:polyprenyl synthetase family protein [Phycisphaerae bacterium]
MQLPAHADMQNGVSVSSFMLIKDELGQVRTLINEQMLCCADEAGIGRLIEHLNSSGGKMIRPGLVLLAGIAIGKVTDKHIRIAAIVEMIHNATLLHDDVIDEGRTRRGQATVNSLWGNESAVLLGDFLLSRVFRMCADLEPEVVKIIATAAGRTCEGELRQIAQRENWQLNESEYLDIVTEKSAALFSSCCRLGGLLAGAGEDEVRRLSDFGLNLGIAFQITDDLLDIIGDEAKAGKTLGSDVDKNKLTLAVIHLLGTIDEKKRASVIDSLCNKAGMIEMLKSSGSLEYAHDKAQEFVTKAIAQLAGLKEGEAKNALIETARLIGQR